MLAGSVLALASGAVSAGCADRSDGDPAAAATASTSTTTSGSTTLLPAPLSPVPPRTDERKVHHAVDQLDDLVEQAMDQTGVPGVAIGVVYQGEVIFTKGYGLRRVGSPEQVDPDTVFQVASVSKSVSSTIIAGVVGAGMASWTDPVRTWNPDFALKDPYVTERATLADLLSHRTGLFESSGDFLDQLGWDRDYILSVLDQEPLDAFRSTYHYSNWGITEAGVAAADAAGTTWEDLADTMLFQRIAMDSSSFRYADFEARDNKAVMHVSVGPREDKVWEHRYERNNDAAAPAGGLSSTVVDMTKFLQLQLGDGTFDGEEVIDADALQVTHVPHQELSQPTVPGVRTAFYGLGWNVSYDEVGRVQLDHSGAFPAGASTNVMLMEGEQLGIVTLTNSQTRGVPEGINSAFLDIATHGEQTVDWLGAYGKIFADMDGNSPGEKWAATPAAAAVPLPLDAYVGTYDNSYYGPLTVSADGGGLSMSMGPPDTPTTFVLSPFDGDVFTFDTIDNIAGKSGATFSMGPDGTATSVNLAFYDLSGLGTFTRS